MAAMLDDDGDVIKGDPYARGIYPFYMNERLLFDDGAPAKRSSSIGTVPTKPSSTESASPSSNGAKRRPKPTAEEAESRFRRNLMNNVATHTGYGFITGSAIGFAWHLLFHLQARGGMALLKTQPPPAVHTGAQVAKVFFALGLVDAGNRLLNHGKPADGATKKS